LADDVHDAVERAARESYGRLLAFLAARSHDVAAAEDALGDAFHAALRTWVGNGVPQNPDAWLLTAARRRLIDRARRERVRDDALQTLLVAAEEAQEMTTASVEFPDERLKLLFVCAHPAIDAAARTPLMLQTVLSLDAARIASAFLVSPTAMGRRLTRAKAKIRDARIAFELPETGELPERLDAVLEAIYAAYGSGWDDITGADPRRQGLTGEAILLGRLLTKFLPAEPEALGLLALMLHCEARRDARRSPAGAYVPLSEQDVSLWSKPLTEQAEHLLVAAAQAGRMGRFQLEAAIQSVHARRAITGETNWESIALLYEGLVRIAPTVGAMLGRAAAIAEAKGADAGWSLLEAIPAEAVLSYQPYWALRAHLLQRLGRAEGAMAAYTRAIGLSADPAMRDFLVARASEMSR
jgi:predicted RNA polymerase sigma factor